MRFSSHTRRIKYVVAGHPRSKIAMPDGSTISNPGLEARFLNHHFDSENSQREKGWTDEQRIIVEKYLLGHKDFDRPGGFFLDTVDGSSKADVLRAAGHPWTEEAALQGQERCLHFSQDPDHPGEVLQCPNPVLAGTEYCSRHQIEDATDEQGPPPEPAPVKAPEPENESWSMPLVGS